MEAACLGRRPPMGHYGCTSMMMMTIYRERERESERERERERERIER